MRKLIKRLNNEQIKHIASAFRILGVAAFLSVIAKAESFGHSVALVTAWLALESIAVLVLHYLTPEDKKHG